MIAGRGAFLTENKSLQCQLAVAAVQTSFVVGSVYLKSSFRLVAGLHFHPVIFAFARGALQATWHGVESRHCTRRRMPLLP